MADRIAIACDLASAPRRVKMPGRVVSCAKCEARVFLSDDARQHCEREHGGWIAMCIPCAREEYPQERWQVTPLARALKDTLDRQQ